LIDGLKDKKKETYVEREADRERLREREGKK